MKFRVRWRCLFVRSVFFSSLHVMLSVGFKIIVIALIASCQKKRNDEKKRKAK